MGQSIAWLAGCLFFSSSGAGEKRAMHAYALSTSAAHWSLLLLGFCIFNQVYIVVERPVYFPYLTRGICRLFRRRELFDALCVL